MTTPRSPRPVATPRQYKQAPEYSCWKQMVYRCTNPEHPSYPRYGGRGITVCDEWLVYENFLRDMGPRPSEDLTIERIDNNAGYFPGNVRWASHADQQRNRRCNRYLEHDGRRMVITDWAREVGISLQSLQKRLRNGWSVERALTTPPDQRFAAPEWELTHNGETKTLSQWAEETGILACTIRARIKYGWSVERALTEKTHPNGVKRNR
jgi:hypothetical protein